jgi:hypothetical protein
MGAFSGTRPGARSSVLGIRPSAPIRYGYRSQARGRAVLYRLLIMEVTE